MKTQGEPERTRRGLRTEGALALGAGAAAFVCGGLALARGLLWTVPMTVSLAVGIAPLGHRLVAGRAALLRALSQAPPRRYRLPYGSIERSVPQRASLEEWIAKGVSLGSIQNVGRLGECSALGSDPLLSILRLRYLGAPYDACVPAVLLRRSDGCLGITWSGPDAALVAHLPPPAWEWSMEHGPEAWAAAVAAAYRADGARAADLRVLGGLGIIPEAVAEHCLTEAGYQRVAVVPVAALADSLTLAELEFAWPVPASFGVKPFGSEKHGIEGLHATGERTTSEGQLRLDLVIVRTSDTTTVAYARRALERSPSGAGT